MSEDITHHQHKGQGARQMRRRVFIAAIGLGALLFAGLASAQDTILHEFFIIPQSDQPTTPRPSAAEGDSEGGPADDLSEALAAENEAQSNGPPPLTIENSGEELEFTASGNAVTPGGDPAPTQNGPLGSSEGAVPDRNTTLDQDLTYFSVFNPSVVPWKRVEVRDAVLADYQLYLRDARPYPIEVKDRPAREGYERFWGSLLIHMEKGRRVPIPSVAPRVEVLRYQTEPPTYLKFYRDLADNYYISGDYTGTVRVNYQMEAPASYFGGEIDPTVRVADLNPRLRPRLPGPVKQAARRAIEAIGVPTEGSFKEQLSALVAYFRAFESKAFPTSEVSSDIYLDLVLNKVGVCRHRGFAFVVTAHALGILARYVYNEAHAFVEVKVPRRGWLRIDLGGAAVNFEVRNSADKQLHTPPAQDTLPTPDNYTQGYSHNLGSGQQEADVDGDGEREVMEGVPEQMSGSGMILGPQDEPQGLDPDSEGQAVEEIQMEEMTFPTSLEEVAGDTQTATASKRPTVLRLLKATTEAYRGDTIRIEGVLVSAAGGGLQNRKVEAFLAPKGNYRVETFKAIGEGQTDSEGKLKIDAKVPDTLMLGRWSLYLFFRGDAMHAPSHSN